MRLDALADAGSGRPSAGAAAPRLVLPDGSTQHSVLPFPTVGFTAARCVPGRWDPSRTRDVPWAVGAFLLLRRRAFDAVGGFDERQSATTSPPPRAPRSAPAAPRTQAGIQAPTGLRGEKPPPHPS